MNLHDVVRPLINSINPDTNGVILRSAGYSTDATGKRWPKYLSAQNIVVQVQPLSGGLLRHAEFMNLQGVLRSVYCQGDTQGVMRPFYKGGDLLQFPAYPGDPISNWLITEVIETWSPGWAHVIATLQVDVPKS